MKRQLKAKGQGLRQAKLRDAVEAGVTVAVCVLAAGSTITPRPAAAEKVRDKVTFDEVVALISGSSLAPTGGPAPSDCDSHCQNCPTGTRG